MRSNHLGDSLDFAKGAILRLAMPLLNGPVVIPMLTDQANWTRRHFALHARTLGLPVERILLRNQTFDAAQRQEYFSRAVYPLPAYTDIFLDPDTGFSISRRNRRSEEHVCCCDVGVLLDQNQERVLIIYCHRREGVDGLGQDRNVMVNDHRYAFAYAGKPAAMQFLSNNRKRLHCLRSHLSGCLAPMHEMRLTRILHTPRDNDA
jgi:hypothetical protein